MLYLEKVSAAQLGYGFKSCQTFGWLSLLSLYIPLVHNCLDFLRKYEAKEQVSKEPANEPRVPDDGNQTNSKALLTEALS